MSVESEAYGPNTVEVEALLVQLRELPPREWPKLATAYRELDVEKYEDALAGALDQSGEREAWFALREAATAIAREAAKAYAAAVGEEPRTLEYVKAVNAWDGQHEDAFEESLPPTEERSFIDAACGAGGIVFMRPVVADSLHSRLWSAFESVLGSG